jgi:hypothetical protein
MTKCTQQAAPSFALALAAACCFLAQAAFGQLPTPRLDTVFPAGGKPGSEVEVTIGGGDLDEAKGLVFSHPGVTAVQKMGEASPLYGAARPLPNQFTVKIDGAAPPGSYEVRVQGMYGVSNPRVFLIGKHEQVLDAGGNASPDKATELELGQAVFGRTDKDQIDYYKLSVEKGQRVLIECWAERIDSKMDATLELVDSSGKILAKSRDSLGRDALIDVTAPADDEWTVKVYDFLYEGGGEYFYRLAIDTRAQIDFVFPPAGVPGATGKFTVYGCNLPGGSPAEGVEVDGAPLQKLEVTIPIPAAGKPGQIGPQLKPCEAEVAGFEYRLPTSEGPSNPVWIGLATAPPVLEKEPNDEPAQAHSVSPPCEYMGQSWPLGDVDWVQFEAKAGTVYWIEVFSERLGLPTDPLVVVQQVTKNEQGEEQVREVSNVDDQTVKLGGPGFDRPSDDPVYRLSVDQDAVYRVMVRDLYSGSVASPGHVYRMSIRPAQPDFRLVTALVAPQADKNKVAAWNPTLRKGETTAIDVLTFRRDGFDGDIELAVEGLPAGVTAMPSSIAAGQTSGVVILSAAENAAEWSGPIAIIGKAKIDGKEVVRRAAGGAIAWDFQANQGPIMARLLRDISLGVSGEVYPVSVSFGDGKIQETSRAGKLTIPVKVTRKEGVKGNLQLTPQGLPKEIKVGNVTVADKDAEGKAEITLDPKMKPGLYTIYFQGATKYSYRRNPQAVERAKKDQEQVNKVAMAMAEARKTADAAKQAADKKAADAANLAKQRADEQTNLQKQAEDAAKQSAADAQKAKQAQEAAAKDAENQGLKDAAAAAAKQAAEADARAKDLAAKHDAANAAAEQAAAQSMAAETEKTAATAAAEEADKQAKLVDEEKKRVDKELADLTNAAKPKDVNLLVISTPVVIRVAEAPIEMTPQAPGGPLKQNEKTEITANVTKLFGYDEETDLDVVLPKGLAGLKVAPVKIPKGQTQGKLVVEAAANATPGAHTLQIRARVKFNGQTLEVLRPVPLVIEAAPKKE